MTWLWKGKPFTSDMIGDYQGFVYMITEKSTGMKYIGKKNFWSVRKARLKKGEKRRKSVKKESDWMTYHGSSEKVQSLLEEHGEDAFIREILYLCESKGELSYLEAKEQFDREVLLRDDYYNGIINCRINHNTVKNLKK